MPAGCTITGPTTGEPAVIMGPYAFAPGCGPACPFGPALGGASGKVQCGPASSRDLCMSCNRLSPPCSSSDEAGIGIAYRYLLAW